MINYVLGCALHFVLCCLRLSLISLMLVMPFSWAHPPENSNHLENAAHIHAAQGGPLTILRGEGEYPPHEFHQDMKLVGYHIELIEMAAEYLSIPIEFRDTPWKRGVAMIEHGDADAITFMTRTPEREVFAIFQDDNILSTSVSGLIGLQDSAPSKQYDGTLGSVEHLTIGIQLGFNYGSEFDAATHIHKVELSSVQKLVSTLKAGRIDLALLTLQEYKLAEHRKQVDGIVFLTPAINQFSNYLAFSRARDTESLSVEFARAMKHVKASKAHQQLLEKYPYINY